MTDEHAIRIRILDKYEHQLLARGMNRLALTVRPFTLKAKTFTSQIDKLKPKEISAENQMDWFKQVYDDPFKPWCYCIASEPNDRMAKAVAAFLMQRALMAGAGMGRLPLWHDILGNFENPLIGPDVSRPSFLVLGNVMPNSTNVKFEKLRDLLEYHSSIPRIVVVSGDDPFAFFAKHLYFQLSGCLYLKTSLVKSEVEI